MSCKRRLYGFPTLAYWLRRVLNRAAPLDLAEVRVAAGGLQGARLLLNLQAEKDYWLGTYEPELQAALRDFITQEMVVYDVGANIGYMSLLCARLAGPGGKVFAFEALPENLVRLKRNLALNDFGGRVAVIPAAVVGATQEVRFLIGPSTGMGKADGSAGRQEFDYREAIRVAGLSLDDFAYCQGNPLPNLIKMDIEGGEVLALPGMRHLLEESRPILLLELHGKQAVEVAWDELQQANYQISLMTSPYKPILSLEALGWKSYLVAIPSGAQWPHMPEASGFTSGSPMRHTERGLPFGL